MEVIRKVIHSQDAGFKLSPKKSGETSLNLSNEILNFIIEGPMSLDSERQITFQIYKEDFLKSLAYITNKLPLYKSSSREVSRIDFSASLFYDMLSRINDFFGQNEIADYHVNLLYRNDGRIYLNGLKVGNFSLRSFLVEENSSLLFLKEKGVLSLRVIMGATIENPNEENPSNNFSTSLPYLTAMRTKPFLLLAGISGTGKSRIVRELAFMSCPKELQDKDETMPGNYCMVEVKPNWHDSTELLGYYSNIRNKYVFTPFVKFLIKAMKYPDAPFFVCLDEMNLAPVEQYFAEFLSVLETRKRVEEEDDIKSGALVDKLYFDFLREYDEKEYKDLGESHKLAMQACDEIGLKSDGCKEIRETLMDKGLCLPSNVVVIGTVNMDDTTYKFSRKVIDRAMTIEMNGGKLNEIFGGSAQLSYPADSDIVSIDNFKACYVTADDAIQYCNNMQPFANIVMGSENDDTTIAGRLKQINDILDGTPFKVSYRVMNELVIYLAVLLDNENEGVTEEKFRSLVDKAVEDIMLMKILPRIEGDKEMLENRDTEGNMLNENKLDRLSQIATGQAKQKIDEMRKRLDRSDFTRFWP